LVGSDVVDSVGGDLAGVNDDVVYELPVEEIFQAQVLVCSAACAGRAIQLFGFDVAARKRRRLCATPRMTTFAR
jgi:hypothetical protein